MSESKPAINNTWVRIRALEETDKFRKIGKLRRKAAKNKALGIRRLDTAQRVAHYQAQNGGGPLTARQAARVEKKAAHAAANPVGA
jgi:hypothetical protein